MRCCARSIWFVTVLQYIGFVTVCMWTHFDELLQCLMLQCVAEYDRASVHRVRDCVYVDRFSRVVAVSYVAVCCRVLLCFSTSGS